MTFPRCQSVSANPTSQRLQRKRRTAELRASRSLQEANLRMLVLSRPARSRTPRNEARGPLTKEHRRAGVAPIDELRAVTGLRSCVRRSDGDQALARPAL